MKVRVTVKKVHKYDRISFMFPAMEAATKFIDVTMQTAETEVEFEIEPIYPEPIAEETTEEGDEE